MPPEDDKAHADSAAAKDLRGSQSNPEKEPEERKFSVEELQDRARMSLGVSPTVVAGALATEKAKTFTLEDAEQLINAFLKRPIERDVYDAEAVT